MVQMKSGIYGGKDNKMIRPEDDPFSLTPEEEARLVKRGVAKYVNNSGETVVEGKSLDNMTVAELRVMGKELGLTFKVGTTKAAMVEVLTSKMEQAETEDDENPDEGEDRADTDDTGDDAPPVINPTEAVQ